MESQRTEQRSFRVSRRTLELLDAASEVQGISRNALADQLLSEAVRTDRHPLVRFRAGAAGRRRPALTGTRLYVHDVMGTVRASDGSVEDAAAYLDVSPALVHAAVAYYADFSDEVETDIEAAAAIASEERARYEAQQRALG